ncbi:MAG: hypothetical protein JXA69_14945 [Phycisphaerae bacterium]|nr:hypothetical protein [Phycisphaerae bacterium]
MMQADCCDPHLEILESDEEDLVKMVEDIDDESGTEADAITVERAYEELLRRQYAAARAMEAFGKPTKEEQECARICGGKPETMYLYQAVEEMRPDLYRQYFEGDCDDRRSIRYVATLLTDFDLEGYARRRRRRWHPPKRALHEAVLPILEDEHPMTLRQLYYRLVSAGALPATKSGYDELKRLMRDLRMDGDISLDWIVDNARSTSKPSSWSGLADFAETVQSAYRKDFWASLPEYVAVLTEKDAVAGVLYPVTSAYDVPLHVCRGHGSIAYLGQIARQWQKIEKPIHAYYVGDFDPTGMDIERDIQKKLRHFGARGFTWTRLGVVNDDFDAFDLLELPIKAGDSRADQFRKEYGDRCAELDALPPDELRRRVEDAIAGHIDEARWEKLRAIEREEAETWAEAMKPFSCLGTKSDDDPAE